MRNEVGTEHSAKALQLPVSEQIRVENKIEARLCGLGNAINDMVDAPYPGLLRERGHIREALEELIVKEATLRWIIRVARTTEGEVQQRLWSDIDKALTSLEKVAESIAEPSSAGQH